MNNTGIWIDSDKAKIFVMKDGEEEFKEIASAIEHYHLRGGSRSSTPYGPQEVTSESKLLERKKHQLRSFFSEIKESLVGSGPIVVYGPAETKLAFQKDLENDPKFQERLSAIHASDSMTDNQFKALVREHYKKHSENN